MVNLLVILMCSSWLSAGVESVNSPQPDSEPQTLIVCGWDEVYVLDMADKALSTPPKIWSWKAKDCNTLPETHRGLFGSTDDCKPMNGKDQILISSSASGVALVERRTKQALFYANVKNAHSVEMLPETRIVVAASTNPEGNRLVLFDALQSDKPLWHNELYSAHGVVWDAQREVLWALGYDQLRAYHLSDWDSATPSLTRVATYVLPDEQGHDLQAVPKENTLLITTHSHVYLFDRERFMFTLHPQLKDKERVKSVSINPKTGQLAYTQAEGQNWWTEHIHFLNPSQTVSLPGERIYKVRWNQ
jgi:hypothetical protein